MSSFPPSRFFPSRLSLPKRFHLLLETFGVPVFDRQVRIWDAEQLVAQEKVREFEAKRERAFRDVLVARNLQRRDPELPGLPGWMWDSSPMDVDGVLKVVEGFIPDRWGLENRPSLPAFVPIRKGKMRLSNACALLSAVQGHEVSGIGCSRLGPYAALLHSVEGLTEADNERLCELLDTIYEKFERRFPEAASTAVGGTNGGPKYDLTVPLGTEPIPWSGWDMPSQWARVLGLSSRVFTANCRSGDIVHEKRNSRSYRIDRRQLPSGTDHGAQVSASVDK